MAEKRHFSTFKVKVQLVRENAMVIHVNYIVAERVRVVFGMDCLRMKRLSRGRFCNDECERVLNGIRWTPALIETLGYVACDKVVECIFEVCRTLFNSGGMHIHDGYNCLTISALVELMLRPYISAV